MLQKELKVIYRNKMFIVFKVLFALLYCSIGYGAKVVYEQMGTGINIIYYFIFVYSMSLTLLMLHIYPISKEITEQMSGGIENILATGFSVKKLVMYKVIGLFLTIYIT